MGRRGRPTAEVVLSENERETPEHWSRRHKSAQMLALRCRMLSALGIGLAIDDFGTGYSSLSYLKRLPVSEIKIDKSFVMSMTSQENDAVIVRSTVDLGRNLGLRVVAEGVETTEMFHELMRLGCDIAQGYLLSRPLPADELTAWAKDWRSAEKGVLVAALAS